MEAKQGKYVALRYFSVGKAQDKGVAYICDTLRKAVGALD